MNRLLPCLVLLAGLGIACSASAGTIADAAAQPPGTQVTISDALILSTIDLVPDPAYRSFQLRDATRAITVYGTNAAIAAALTGWAAGDGINITGVTTLADGTLRLEPPVGGGGSVAGFAVSGRTSSLPFPFPTSALSVGLSDIATPYESNLVRLQGVSFDLGSGSGVFVAETTYTLAGGSALVRIATADLGLVGQPIPTGLVDITGIVIPDPDGTGYVLAPRSIGDIGPAPSAAALLGLGGLFARRRRRSAAV
jgi:MYXO-CTERM domain-containing protein